VKLLPFQSGDERDGARCLRATDWRTPRLSSSVRVTWPGMAPDRVFFKLSKLLNQERALSAPCLSHFCNYGGGAKAVVSLGENHEKAWRFGMHRLRKCLNAVISALRRHALARRGNAADGLHRHLMSHYGLLHRVIRRLSADASRWWAADARAEHTGARPNRAVMAKRRRHVVLTPTVVRFWEVVQSWRRILW
jgi:hypothetical protein